MTGDTSGTSRTGDDGAVAPASENPETVVLTKEPTGLPQEGDAVAHDAGSGWHPLNVTHLVLGAAFVGLAIVWAVLARDDVSLDDARWLLPLPWLVGGGLGLLATVARGSRRQRP